MEITLDPEVEASLQRQAERKGLPVDKYIEALVRERQGLEPKQSKSPAEVRAAFAEWISKVHSLPQLDGRKPEDLIEYDEWGLPR